MSKLQEVAELAKVSKATVSRVINNSDSVSKISKQKVLTAIEELNFQINELKRSNQGTMTIGVILPFDNNISQSSFGIDIVLGAEERAFENDYMILIGNSLGKEQSLVTKMLDRDVEGIIMLSTDLHTQHLKLLEHSGVPLVLVDQKVDGINSSVVRGDNFSGSIDLMNHLFNLGHQHIAMISPTLHSTFRDRIRGFQISMLERGYSVTKDNLIILDKESMSIEKAMSLVLNSEPRPTALFLGRADYFNAAVEVIQRYNLRIPEDMSIVTFDDTYSQLSGEYQHFLTAVNQSGKLMGSMAVGALFQLIRNPGMEQQEIVLPGTLNIRKSTSPPS